MVLLSASPGFAQNSEPGEATVSVKDSIFNITLSTAQGAELNLGEIQQKKAALLVMMSPECPICQKYTHKIHLLYAEYKKKGVALYLVFPGKYFDLPTINSYLKEQILEYPALLDKDYQLTRLLNATVTPEVFLINLKGEVAYSGMIDNWYYALGKKRGVVTEEYVKDALNAELAGEPIKVKRKAPIGCPIYGLKD
jgi:thiol-disulfide isomerase/thioredoxin